MSQPPQKRRRQPNHRSGYVLVLFVMMAFVLVGFAALIIDLGFARLTQRQMQMAADGAALEGLRWRDVQCWEDLPPAWLADNDFQNQVGPVGSGVLSAQQRDAVRRWAASSAAANVFDDDLNPRDGDPLNFGAGPVVGFQANADPAAVQPLAQGRPSC